MSSLAGARQGYHRYQERKRERQGQRAKERFLRSVLRRVSSIRVLVRLPDATPGWWCRCRRWKRRGGGENHEETPHTAVNTTSLTEAPGRVSRRFYLCTRTHVQISFFTCLAWVCMYVCARTPIFLHTQTYDSRFVCVCVCVSRVNWCGMFFASCPFMWKVCCAGACGTFAIFFSYYLPAHIHGGSILDSCMYETDVARFEVFACACHRLCLSNIL